MKEATDLSLRLLIERVRDYAIFTLAPTGIITSWNPGAVKIKGYTADEAIGHHFSMLYREEDAAKGIPDHNLRIAEAEGTFIEHEGIRKKKNGDLFTAEVEIVALVHEGKLVGFAKVIRDVTEKIEMRDELRRVNGDLDQFTAIAAHDLQEPLRMVTSYLSLLSRHGSQSLDAKLRSYLDNASDGAARMSRLITYLRNLALRPLASTSEHVRCVLRLIDFEGARPHVISVPRWSRLGRFNAPKRRSLRTRLARQRTWPMARRCR